MVMFAFRVAVVICVLSSAGFSSGAAEDNNRAGRPDVPPRTHGADKASLYRVLTMAGRPVKWGDPHAGTPARVSYAFARRQINRADARNCRLIGPFPKGQRAALQAVVERSLNAWQTAGAIEFLKTDDPQSADLVFGRDMHAQGWAHADIKMAEAGAPAADFTVIRGAAVCLNLSRSLAAAGWSRILLHEIGHVIGLDHPGRFGPVMAYSENNGATRLQAGDRAGAVLLYGPPPLFPKSATQTLMSAGRTEPVDNVAGLR